MKSPFVANLVLSAAIDAAIAFVLAKAFGDGSLISICLTFAGLYVVYIAMFLRSIIGVVANYYAFRSARTSDLVKSFRLSGFPTDYATFDGDSYLAELVGDETATPKARTDAASIAGLVAGMKFASLPHGIAMAFIIDRAVRRYTE